MVPASEVPCSLYLSQGATGGYAPRHTGQVAALTASDRVNRVWAMRRAWHSEGSRARLTIGLGQFQSGKAAQTRDEVACSDLSAQGSRRTNEAGSLTFPGQLPCRKARRQLI